MKNLFLILALMGATALTACGDRQFVKGDYAKDVDDPNLLTDKWSESDMQVAVNDLVAKRRGPSQRLRTLNVRRSWMVTRLQNKNQ